MFYTNLLQIDETKCPIRPICLDGNVSDELLKVLFYGEAKRCITRQFPLSFFISGTNARGAKIRFEDRYRTMRIFASTIFLSRLDAADSESIIGRSVRAFRHLPIGVHRYAARLNPARHSTIQPVSVIADRIWLNLNLDIEFWP